MGAPKDITDRLLKNGLGVLSSMQAARDVVEDFSADEVVYLELRSTPRANPQTGVCGHLWVFSRYLRDVPNSLTTSVQIALPT